MRIQLTRVIVLLLVLPLLVMPALAQDDLQTITAGDGSFHFSLPSDWLTVDTGSIVIAATSEAALDTASPVPAGDALIVLMGPVFFADQFGITPDTSLQSVLQTVIDEMGGDDNWPDFGEIQDVELPDGRALAGVEASEDSPLDGALAIIGSEDGGFLGALIITPAGEVDQFENIYFEMLQSLYGGPADAPASSAAPIPTDWQQITAGDGSVTFGLPSDWLTVDAGSIVIAATSEAAIASLDTADPVPEDEALIVVMGPAFFAEQFGITPNLYLEGVLYIILDEMAEDENWPDFGEVQLVELPDGRELAGVEALDDSPLDGALAILNSEGGGFLGALIVTPAGDVDQYEDIFLEMLQSLHGSTTGPAQGTAPAGSGNLTDTSPVETTALIEQWASFATGTSEYTSTDWGFIQATGAPDTKGCIDEVTAWASASPNTDEVLILTFDQAVYPTQINIRQTLDPGAIVQVDLGNSAASGQNIILPNSADPPGNTPCPGTFALDVTGVSSPVDTVVIYLDQSITGTWNEIDAVQLVGTVDPPTAAVPTKGQATTPEQEPAVDETPVEETPVEEAPPVKGAATGEETATTEETTAAPSGDRFETILDPDGLFGIDTVPDWTFRNIDGIIEMHSTSNPDATPADIVTTPGEVFVQVFPQDLMVRAALIPLAESERPQQALEHVLNLFFGVTPEARPYTYTTPPGIFTEVPSIEIHPVMTALLASYQSMTGSGIPETTTRLMPTDEDATVIALEKNGVLLFVVVYGDIASHETQIGALLDSITVGEQGATTGEETTTTEETSSAEEPAATTGDRFEVELYRDGQFGIDSLMDWMYMSFDGIIEISSEIADWTPADVVDMPGEVYIQIFPPEVLTQTGLLPVEGDDPPTALVQNFAAWRNLEALDIMPYVAADETAAIANLPAATLEPAMAYLLLNYSLVAGIPTPAASDRPTPESGDAVVVGLEKNGALFLVAVYGDLVGMEQQIVMLLDSITLE